MKSQINLLSDEFKPHFELICGSHLLGIIVIVAIACGLVYSGLAYQHATLLADVDSSKKEIATMRKTVEELTAEITQRTTDPILESKLASLQARTKDRSNLLDDIRSLSTLKQRSFSSLFTALSDSHSNNLWLTSFAVKPNELSLSGLLTSPNALPLWIQELSKTNFFKGQSFNIAKVVREQDSLRFELRSEPGETLPIPAETTETRGGGSE